MIAREKPTRRDFLISAGVGAVAMAARGVLGRSLSSMTSPMTQEPSNSTPFSRNSTWVRMSPLMRDGA